VSSGIFEQDAQDVYRVEMDDGEVATECTANHLWWYLRRSRAHFRTVETDKHKNGTFDQW
jgi:hypothetical protein